MIPYILAAVGGYLIGDSLKGKQYAEGGMMDEEESKGAYSVFWKKPSREKMYNFLKDDLAALEKAIEANNQEEIEKFFSYWNIHLKSLEPKTGRKRMYYFLKDDLVGLEAATKELPSSKEEIERFFSYWNTHLKSLKGKQYADGGITNGGEGYIGSIKSDVQVGGYTIYTDFNPDPYETSKERKYVAFIPEFDDIPLGNAFATREEAIEDVKEHYEFLFAKGRLTPKESYQNSLKGNQFARGGGVSYGIFGSGRLNRNAWLAANYIGDSKVELGELQSYLEKNTKEKFNKEKIYTITRTLYETNDYQIDDNKDWKLTKIYRKRKMAAPTH